MSYHLLGGSQLTKREQKEADINGNGKVDQEDMYMLIYGYYLHMDTNPDLPRNKFYIELLPNLNMMPGDMNSYNDIDETDLRLFRETLAGNPRSYKYLVTADVNKDLKIDSKDAELYEQEYMSDIPFTYTVDKKTKTMTITGAKDTQATCLRIASAYTVDRVRYTVNAIGGGAFSSCKSLEDSPFYQCENCWLIIANTPKDKAGWGSYWNYMDEDTKIMTVYLPK